jgi:hypothetical protein
VFVPWYVTRLSSASPRQLASEPQSAGLIIARLFCFVPAAWLVQRVTRLSGSCACTAGHQAVWVLCAVQRLTRLSGSCAPYLAYEPMPPHATVTERSRIISKCSHIHHSQRRLMQVLHWRNISANGSVTAQEHLMAYCT